MIYLNFFSMNTSIGIIISIVLLALVVRFVSKLIVRILASLLIVVAVLGLMYYQGWGPFKQDLISIQALEERYCVEQTDRDICDCIVQAVRKDMDDRFSKVEMAAIQSDRAKQAYVLSKSLTAIKPQAKACLAERNAEEKYEAFIHQLLPGGQNWLKKGQEQWIRLKQSVTEGTDSLKKEIEEIDKRY